MVSPSQPVDVHLGFCRKVSTGGANLSTAPMLQSSHIDSGTLGGIALLRGWVRSQLAHAAACGQLPQSIGVSVTVGAAWVMRLCGDMQII